jgi:Ca2+-binding EF-hand superfamily protein
VNGQKEEINKEEFIKFFKVIYPSIDVESFDVDALFHAIDYDRDNQISFNEFVIYETLRIGEMDDHNMVVEFYFRLFDKEDKGFIKKSDIDHVLGTIFRVSNSKTPDEVNRFMKELYTEGDINKDGKISKEEFVEAFDKIHFNLGHFLPEYHKLNSSLLKRIVSSIGAMSDQELDEYYTMKLIPDIVDQMGTGDILLFRGIEGFSKLIKISSICNFSHVMMIVRDPSEEVRKAYGIAPDEKEKVFVFESDSEIDLHEGGGVQMLPLTKWIESTAHYYKGNTNTLLCWRKLIHFDVKSKQKDLDEFLLTMNGKLYETSKRQLAISVFGWNRKEDFETVFCSELVAAAYIYPLGLLTDERRANNYVPRDFTSEQTRQGHDILLEGKAQLEREVRIRLEKPVYIEKKKSEIAEVLSESKHKLQSLLKHDSKHIDKSPHDSPHESPTDKSNRKSHDKHE